jgi:hypothetical protein
MGTHKRDSTRFKHFRGAIQKGLDKIRKYYSKFDEKPVYILALGMSQPYLYHGISVNNVYMTVLHPYYKLEYIKLAWGGAAEQAEERASGNANVKNWQDEAQKVVEQKMEEYWNDHMEAMSEAASTAPANDNLDNATDDIGNEFDEHRRKLASQALTIEDDGWEAELCRYLKDIPLDVTRDRLVGGVYTHSFLLQD